MGGGVRGKAKRYDGPESASEDQLDQMGSRGEMEMKEIVPDTYRPRG